MFDAETLLRSMTQLYPPNEGQKHNLTLHENGLELTLMRGKNYQSVVLPRDSLADASHLVAQIHELFSRKETSH